MKYKSDFLREINSRGFIYQTSDIDNLDNLMSKKKITAYIGFDITSDSLHIGSLVQLMLLNWLDHYDHKTIALMGGGTTLIGDPSGKDSTRKILDNKTIKNNIKKIKKTFIKLLDTKNKKTKPIFVNNYKWLKNLNYISFLRDIGKHFTINKMLTFESIKTRLDREQSLSYMEFNYMILQAYDFLELNKSKNCLIIINASCKSEVQINGVILLMEWI